MLLVVLAMTLKSFTEFHWKQNENQDTKCNVAKKAWQLS